jgi:hypothetical protein
MFPLLFATSVLFNKLWFSLPLVVAVSMVYAATRHELMMPILQHAARSAFWIVGFMGIVFAVISMIAVML